MSIAESPAPSLPRTEGAYPPPVLPSDQQPVPDMLAGFATQETIAQAFGVRGRTIRSWTKMENGLPYCDVGKRRLYPIERCREWVLSRIEQRLPPKRRGR